MAKIIKIVGYLLVTIGLSIPIGYETKNEITTYLENKEITQEIVENNYYGILEIPALNFKKNFYPLNNSENNVNKNIYLHPESIMPDNSLSNVILLGHSGNGSKAYFKDLYKLQVNDEVKLYYASYLYTYEIKEIEEQPKTGTLALKRISDNMLTLITCTKNNKNSQTIYYASLKNKENI